MMVLNDYCTSNREVKLHKVDTLYTLERQHVVIATAVAKILLSHEKKQLSICAYVLKNVLLQGLA
jgi:hypothetical protein